MNGSIKYGLVCLWLMGSLPLPGATGLIGYIYDSFYGTMSADVEATDDSDASRHFSVRTNRDGIFRLPALPPGQYSIKASAEGVRDVISGFMPLPAGNG